MKRKSAENAKDSTEQKNVKKAGARNCAKKDKASDCCNSVEKQIDDCHKSDVKNCRTRSHSSDKKAEDCSMGYTANNCCGKKKSDGASNCGSEKSKAKNCAKSASENAERSSRKSAKA